MEIKFDVYFKKNLGTLFKNNEVDLNGLPARTNLQLVLVDRLEINYKVGSNKYTDIVTITDATENLIQIPFKSDVMKVGLNEFEIVAYMKNGDIKTSQTYTYNIDEAIGEGKQTGTGGSSDGHTHNNLNVLNSITQSKVSEWNNKADATHSHSEYASKNHTHNASEIEGLENVDIDLSDYYTKSETYNKTEIDSKIANMGAGGSVDLSNYYTKSETDEAMNDKANKVHTHSEYLTELPSHEHEQYLTEHQDISHKADKTDIYTKAQTDNKISEEIAKAQLGGSGEVDLSAYATKNYVDDEISKIELKEGPQGPKGDTGEQGPQGPAGTVDTSDFYNKEEIDAKIKDLQNSQGSSSVIVKDIFANNELPRVYMTSDRLGLLATKQDAEAFCECEIKINNQTIKCYATGKVQGTTSATFPAKNFTFKFYSDEECSSKQKIDVGWGEQYKYCFKKNWVDTTHTRNLAGARIAYDMVESRPSSEFKTNLQTSPRNGAVDGFPCKLYINGEFWGLYTWNIPKDTWMFNMSNDNPNHMVLCAEKNNNGDMSVAYSTQFRKSWDGIDGNEWSVEAGTLTDSLKNSFNNAINFVMTASDEEFKANISNHFDLYSLLDYYLFSYLTCHYDGLGKNMLMATYDGVHWGACLYDMDSIFGATYDGGSFMASNRPCPSGYQETNSLLWQRIEKCFINELKERYFELRKGALSLGNIITHAEEIYDLVSDRVFNDDKAKWTGLPSQSTNTITRFRNYMRDRAKYVDKCINDLTEPIECTGIRLSSNSLTFTNIESQTLTYTLTPSDTTQEVNWKVSPTGIASVKNGVITPITRGECILTVSCGNQSDTCNIIVDFDVSPDIEGYRKFVFDGSENWAVVGWNNYANAPYGVYDLNINDYVGSDLYFPSMGTESPNFLCYTLDPKIYKQMHDNPQEGICGNVYLGKKLLAISTLDVPKGDVASLKEYLNQNNLVVYFKIK